MMLAIAVQSYFSSNAGALQYFVVGSTVKSQSQKRARKKSEGKSFMAAVRVRV